MLPKSVRVPIALALASTALLGGCGSESSEEEKPASSKPDLGAAEQVVLDYYAKVVDGDAAACELESEKFAAAQAADLDTADCATRVENLSGILQALEVGKDLEQATATSEEESDGRALVEVAFGEDGGGTFLLVRDGDGWLIDEERAEDAGDSGDSGDEVDSEISAQGEAWLEAWCEVTPGDTREDLLATMGEPTAESVDEDGQDQLEWESGPVYLTAWLDEDDTVVSTSAAGELDCD